MQGRFLLFVFFLFFSPKAWANDLGDVDLSGFVGVETRIFTQSPQYADQETGAEISVIFNPEFRYQNEANQFSFIPFYRHDSRDGARSHFDLREAYWLYVGEDWEFLIGVNKVFWGVTESRHLVDIINQKDLVEDFDEEDVLGQPMINFSKYTNLGQLDFYILPYFRERTFSGSNGRFRAVVPVDTDNPIYDSDAKDRHVDMALRWSHYFGNWDIGAYYFYGTGREPRLLPNATLTRFIPYYDLIHQSGLDLQYTHDNWLFKFEGIARSGQGDPFTAATGGFEYSLYQILGSAADLGILGEYHYDGRRFDAPESAFDNDIFAALRFVANDTQDTEILGGITFDPGTYETFYNIEAGRRIGNSYKLKLRSRFFAGADVGEKTFPTHRDDYIQLRLSRYF